ncbi:MAG: glycosyltransferase family 39 protein [Pirellulales bacterium]
MRNSRLRTPLVCLLLGIAVLTVYARTVTFDYVPIDDGYYVAENLRVQAGLTPDNVRWAFTTNYIANWHPLTWLSYMLDCELFGPRAGAIHLVNVAWHLVNSLLLYFVLRQLTGSSGKSAFVALLFALHPLHVESVAWVAERKDVLSGFFFIAVLGAYAAYVRRPSILKYVAIVLLLALGLMAKPMLVTLPCVLLLLDYWPLRRWSPSIQDGGDLKRGLTLIAEKLPLFAVVAASCVVTYLAQAGGNAVTNLERLSAATRIANAGLSYLQYVGKFLWPVNLAVYYPHPALGPDGDTTDATFLMQGIVAAVAILLITLTILVLGKNRRYLAVGWLWFLGTLVPVIGLVQVGAKAWPIGTCTFR